MQVKTAFRVNTGRLLLRVGSGAAQAMFSFGLQCVGASAGEPERYNVDHLLQHFALTIGVERAAASRLRRVAAAIGLARINLANGRPTWIEECKSELEAVFRTIVTA